MYLHHTLFTDIMEPQAIFEAVDIIRQEALVVALAGEEAAVNVVKSCLRLIIAAANEADSALRQQALKPRMIGKLDQALRSTFDKVADRESSFSLKRRLLLWSTVMAFKQISKTGSHSNYDYYFMKLNNQPWNDLSSVRPLKADLVSYRFLVGVYRTMEHQFMAAEPNFAFAFSHCTHSNFSNKRRILTYLSVVRLVLGRPPPRELVQKYSLLDFFTERLIDCWRVGDYSGFLEEVDQHKEWWRSRGLYTIMKERTKLLMWRNVLRRT
ncbi:hypothetical protein M427DRAFT_449304 [Gonapodya prolifera JEL478]|uniref:PCI domain-containing protein n=1 Tax=Gonapodya prolifera (strain JEL478) TaxID=1344416 RepID=A0A139ASD5_GONPJ|nr:hypothetical protein M427DRAFT_449304 [Gonapodya prolifera JEL478]|eukprot:KXS19385.1 hypothetical protein M427DRAFT_449304 [Gonapodya prolifera JEL478]